MIICGTTGEACTLSDQEHVDAIEFAVKHTAGRVPVIAGTGSNDTAYSAELSKTAEQLGADGLLVVTPYYNKTTQGGLVKHFFTIADSVSIPIIVYNVPARTMLNIAPDTYFELSKHENIVATKEAGGQMGAIVQTRALCGGDLDIYSGNDNEIVPILSLGGIGVISTLSNILPRQTHDICELYFNGNVKESADLQIKYIQLIDALFCEVNPIPVKTAMEIMGLCGGELRPPLYEMEEKNRQRLVKAMRDVGLV